MTDQIDKLLREIRDALKELSSAQPNKSNAGAERAQSEELRRLEEEVKRLKAEEAAKPPPKGVALVKIGKMKFNTEIEDFSFALDLRSGLFKFFTGLLSNLFGNLIWSTLTSRRGPAPVAAKPAKEEEKTAAKPPPPPSAAK
jgi:hypothetical protein